MKSPIIKVLLLLFLMMLLAGVVFVPMPELVTYERANVISKGVYWRGFGESGQLLDARASFVKVDEDTGYLFVCHDMPSVNACQQYRIIERQGPIAALSHIL
ncbi:hypothetical protein [Lacimicrobium alkaliphilum]|uniref:Uncharacterized protein n=1 Tax=Lacimicrobium alkaliphilum TaxID=1526571 RepID=A0ABQ1RFS2_9ALTE|nr:hypothetical protein [Lacimicrobium alkaliphilum]GGD66494.1 hypothetical protein GCM10011357_22180 [Lacimicrobium alkaliphilum]